MNKKRHFFILAAFFIFLFLTVVNARDKSGVKVLTNDPVLASSSADAVQVSELAEIKVFSAHPQRKRQHRPARKVLSGIFSGAPASEEKAASNSIAEPEDAAAVTRKVSRKKTESSIAWLGSNSIEYHDPYLDCGKASGSERIWVNGVKELCGLAPCEECFFKTNHPPAFIKKESGGLNLASASALVDNQTFLSWLEENLPVRSSSFLSTRKMLIYPKLEMTDKGVWQLAREVELAYRRKTWKVIEVMAKKSELDTRNFSSFEDYDDEAVK